MTLKIVFGKREIFADGYIPLPTKNAIQFYKDKSDLDYIPPIKVDADLLSDFGKAILCRGESEVTGCITELKKEIQ